MCYFSLLHCLLVVSKMYITFDRKKMQWDRTFYLTGNYIKITRPENITVYNEHVVLLLKMVLLFERVTLEKKQCCTT